jgi:hypothetical protein
MGQSGGGNDDKQKQTQMEITAIQAEYEKNKGKVIDMLVKRIMQVEINFPQNLLKKQKKDEEKQ